MIDSWILFWGGVAMLGAGCVAAGIHALIWARDLERKQRREGK